MDKQLLRHRRISELVEQDNEMAQVLFYFGIRFYEYAEHTLEQVCKLRGLKVDQLVRELESPRSNFQDEDIPLFSYPIDLIIEYLKHAHFLFVKHQLPYIGKLVENFKAEHPAYLSVEKDLKTLYPLFLEDFIHHIYEEEDTLFKYIKMLERASIGKYLDFINRWKNFPYRIVRSSMSHTMMRWRAFVKLQRTITLHQMHPFTSK
jgi:regulator of cell morphogenesis and NO signaling